MAHVVSITYTTLYREGGAQFARAAAALARRKQAQFPDHEIRCVAVETKRAFKAELARIERGTLAELHFIGHSGMYGIMFGTVALPEQLSPHEWRELAAVGLPFTPRGEAFFHCCRSARWFAPYVARTLGVPASGYHWYTTLSARADRFAEDRGGDDVHIIGMIGRKSHGLPGSVAKRLGMAKAERLKRFTPHALDGDPSYDGVAELYDAAYADIGVRGPEIAWLEARLPNAGAGLRWLDIGCGNGALLARFASRIAHGHGVDASPGMLRMARRRFGHVANLDFQRIAGPTIPLPDASVDVVTSFLSFRYLDWDPLMNDIKRVLVPGGKLLIVDMVAAPIAAIDLPLLARSKATQWRSRAVNREFHTRLDALVRDPRWKKMLEYNPIRAAHEYVWYLESRFPGRTVETLDIGYHARMLAFDSGPLQPGMIAPQTYP